MDSKRIKEIIKEEIAKVYEDTDILNSFLELKEAVLKFNRLVDEGFDDAQKIYDRIFKYNLTDIDKMEDDKKKIDEMIVDIKEVSDRMYGYAYNSDILSDDEQIDVEEMYESTKKYLYSLEGITDTISDMISKFEEAKEDIANNMKGVSPLHDTNKFKIFVN